MIRSIRHKGLKRLHEDDDPGGVLARHVTKLRDILVRLDAAQTRRRYGPSGFPVASAQGKLKGFYAATVRANWRVVFRFADRNAFDIDYLDYR